MIVDTWTSSSRRLSGTATVNMVLDWLEDFDVVSAPDNPSRAVTWCAVPLRPEKNTPADDRTILYLVEATGIEQLFTQHPNAIGLVILQQDEPFSTDAFSLPPAFHRQLAVVRSKVPASKNELQGIALSTIYSGILEIREWANALTSIIARKGSIQEIIDASEKLFDNFIDVNDSTYSLIARTKNIDPVDPLSMELVRLGCHNVDAVKSAESIGALEEWRDQTGVHVFEPDSTVPFKYVTDVLRDGNSYAGHVVMVCNNHDATPGMLDLFKMLSSACQQVVNGAFFNESPAAVFLRKVIDDPRLTQAYFDEQSALLNLETSGRFGLTMIDYQSGDYAEQPSWIASMLQKSYPGCLIFSYESSLLVLGIYQEDYVNHRKENLNGLESFCQEMNCMAYTSDVFERLRDLRFALKQTRIARSYKTCIDIELRPIDNIDNRRTILFRDAFAYCRLDGREQDPDLWSFCMGHTVLDDIAAADPGHSVNDTKLLYCYLFNERKTTPTAQQLHIHRNNVLYRIGSIEKRFGIDLDQFGERERLICCYRYKILTSNKFRQLLV